MLNFKKLGPPLLFAFLILFTVSSCMEEAPSSSADPFADCRYGAPKPIFNEGLRSVLQHGFQLEEERAVEDLSFEDGLQLSIIQTGCDYIHQEFRFYLTQPYKAAPSSYWIQEAINKFNRLGHLGPAYVIYASLADAIKERSMELTLGQSTELQPGFFAKIDDGRTEKGNLLIVTLSEQPSGSVASK